LYFFRSSGVAERFAQITKIMVGMIAMVEGAASNTISIIITYAENSNIANNILIAFFMTNDL
jgi:hypothetical protein